MGMALSSRQFNKNLMIDQKNASPTSVELKLYSLDTVLGHMVAIGDNHCLYLLEFLDKPNLVHQIERLKLQLKTSIVPGHTAAIRLIQDELKAYFQGKLGKFTTPFYLLGSDFQRSVWQQLLMVPYGETATYRLQATAIARPSAYRAVANANGTNRLAIIIPCHRIINSNGTLGGYSSGIGRKQWLIDHEKQYKRLRQ